MRCVSPTNRFGPIAPLLEAPNRGDAHELAAASGENRGTPDQASPILLAAAGEESPHTAAVWRHATKDCGLPSPAGQASRRPKQLSVLSETGEGKVFEEWVGEASVFGVEILPQPSERLCTQNLAGTLHTDGVGSMLSVGREVKMEIPD
jgi:hypothetical protein